MEHEYITTADKSMKVETVFFMVEGYLVSSKIRGRNIGIINQFCKK
jgi:hypothetical protein